MTLYSKFIDTECSGDAPQYLNIVKFIWYSYASLYDFTNEYKGPKEDTEELLERFKTPAFT